MVKRLKLVELARRGNRNRVHQHRVKHQRIGYVPSATALAAIEVVRGLKLEPAEAGTIVGLLTAGLDTISGKNGAELGPPIEGLRHVRARPRRSR